MVSDTIFALIDPLIAAIHRLNVRPACFPSALVCLATTHKLLIVLSSIEVDDETMNMKKREWTKVMSWGEYYHHFHYSSPASSNVSQ